MWTLITTLELPIAHRLQTAFSGLCVGNVGVDKQPTVGKPVVHGHNYFITFEISSNHLNEDDMVVDFKRIKEILHEEFDQYDHSLILKYNDPMIDYYGENSLNSRLFIWEHNPTAEYMAFKWYHDLYDVLIKLIPDLKLRISVEETSHNKITYEE